MGKEDGALEGKADTTVSLAIKLESPELAVLEGRSMKFHDL